MSAVLGYALAVALGLALGYALPPWRGIGRVTSVVQSIALYGLMLMMGMRMGMDGQISSSVAWMGLQALMLAVASITGSVLCVFVYERALGRQTQTNPSTSPQGQATAGRQPLATIARIAGCICLGFLAARFGQGLRALAALLENNETIIEVLLLAMIAASGMDIGQQKGVLRQLRTAGWGLLMVPVLGMVGSILAALPVGMCLGFRPAEAAALAAGGGWYSLAGVVLSEISTQLGVIAFLSNLLRELLSLFVIPFVAKYMGPITAIAPGGGTTMDITLPVILQATGAQNAALAFSNGLLLSLSIPSVLRVLVNLAA